MVPSQYRQEFEVITLIWKVAAVNERLDYPRPRLAQL
jgi:hypothetical protein